MASFGGFGGFNPYVFEAKWRFEQEQVLLQQQFIDRIGTLEQASQLVVAPKPKEMNPLLLLT